ncbi:MAG: hypothetical protein P1U34_07135 [Coxiellaceae bacterium]|nr:hypothetical protein [Coxiellaceae bacterium]
MKKMVTVFIVALLMPLFVFAAKPYTSAQIKSMKPALNAILPIKQINMLQRLCVNDNLCHCINTNSEAQATLGQNLREAAGICADLRYKDPR